MSLPKKSMENKSLGHETSFLHCPFWPTYSIGTCSKTTPAPIQCTTCSYECISKIVVRAFLDVVRPQTNLQQSISRWGNVFLSQKSHFFMIFEDFWKYQEITKITIPVIELSFLCFLTFFSKQGLISKQKTRGVCWSMFSEDWSTRDRPVVICFIKNDHYFKNFLEGHICIQIYRNEDSRRSGV